MKIEMAESLLLSYFKHVKGCLFYQLNWKVASNWQYTEEAYDNAQNIYNIIIHNREFSDVFKTEFAQLMRQAEIDIIGMDSNNNIYVADIAFHEAGLNYGSKIETKNRVFKKLLRSYLNVLLYLPNRQYELIFASPKVNPATEKIIKDYFIALNNIFNDDKVKFKYFSNDLFKTEILLPTISSIRNDSDTTELCGRAFKLLDLFDLIMDNFIVQKPNVNNNPQQIQEPINPPNPGGGQIVFIPDQETFRINLVRTQRARYTITYFDGRQEIKYWDANGFTNGSNLINNIRSGKLRDWEKKGIQRAVFEIIE
jgi:hypothetical protein